MKKLLILILAAVILFSGCVDQTADRTVKKGDNISVNYIGSFENGKVFDTSIESVARANGLYTPGARYEPYNFTVGKVPSETIEGFDEGVIGMKVGDNKILNIPPEKAYPINPDRIQVAPIVEEIPATTVIPRFMNVSEMQFEQFFGANHSVGDTVQIPDSNLNITITNITSQVSLKYNMSLGYNVWNSRAPWNETVVKIDDQNITLKPIVKINDIIQLHDMPYNTTVIGINDKNITLRHNPIPETTISLPNMFGQMIPTKISFNETSIIMDQNPEVAGKTLIFNVTLISINK